MMSWTFSPSSVHFTPAPPPAVELNDHRRCRGPRTMDETRCRHLIHCRPLLSNFKGILHCTMHLGFLFTCTPCPLDTIYNKYHESNDWSQQALLQKQQQSKDANFANDQLNWVAGKCYLARRQRVQQQTVLLPAWHPSEHGDTTAPRPCDYYYKGIAGIALECDHHRNRTTMV